MESVREGPKVIEPRNVPWPKAASVESAQALIVTPAPGPTPAPPNKSVNRKLPRGDGPKPVCVNSTFKRSDPDPTMPFDTASDKNGDVALPNPGVLFPETVKFQPLSSPEYFTHPDIEDPSPAKLSVKVVELAPLVTRNIE